MVKMENDANGLVIRIPRVYADQVHELSLGRIIGEAIRVQDLPLEDFRNATVDDNIDTFEALNANQTELYDIKAAVDAFSSAVREGLILEQEDKERTT